MTWLVWYLLLILGVHNTMPYEPSTRLGSPGSIRFSCVVPVKISYQHLTACFCLRGIDQSILFYDMPHCMKSELCLEMIQDILYAVKSLRYIITFSIISFTCLQIIFPVVARCGHMANVFSSGSSVSGSSLIVLCKTLYSHRAYFHTGV